MDFKYKSLIILMLCFICIGAVSASDIANDNFNLATTDISNDIWEISADSDSANDLNALDDDGNLLSANDLNALDDDDGNLLSANDLNALDADGDLISDDSSGELLADGENGNSDGSDESSGTVTTDDGGIRNISFSDGYNGYCIDMKLHGAQAGESFTVRDTSIIVNHIDNTYVGDYIKILFYNYYDEVNSDKELACEAIWTFTDRYYRDSSDPLVQKVLKDYDDGLRVPDHGAVKKIDDRHEMVFDFETLISSSESIQNYFGYKVLIRETEDSNNSSDDNSTDNSSSDENSTDDKSAENSTEEINGTGDVDEDTDTTDGSSDDGTVDSNGKSSKEGSDSNNGNGERQISSGIVAGNPFFALIISLILLVFVPLRNKK